MTQSLTKQTPQLMKRRGDTEEYRQGGDIIGSKTVVICRIRREEAIGTDKGEKQTIMPGSLSGEDESLSQLALKTRGPKFCECLQPTRLKPGS